VATAHQHTTASAVVVVHVVAEVFMTRISNQVYRGPY
jgi:hypothetical protein